VISSTNREEISSYEKLIIVDVGRVRELEEGPDDISIHHK